MYFDGKFREYPALHYTGTRMAIFKNRLEDHICIVSLCRMFKKVDEDATRVTFWFCAPGVDLDGGLHPIRDHDDVKLMNKAHWGLATRIIYACSGDDPFEKPLEHGGDNVLEPNSTMDASTTIKNTDGVHNTKIDSRDGGVQKKDDGVSNCNPNKPFNTDDDDDDDDEPEWLKEGLEKKEDEDIFASKKDVDRSSKPEGGSILHSTHFKPYHVFSFPEKVAIKSLAKSETSKEKKSSKNKKQSAGPDSIGEIPPHISFQISSQAASQAADQHPSQIPSQAEAGNSKKAEERSTEEGAPHTPEEDWQEPVISDEELLDKCGSNDEGHEECHDFNPEVEFLKPHFELKVGQKFSNFRVFRYVLIEWLVREGYEVDWVKNYSKKIIAKCAKGCSWRIRATPVQGETTFQIKSLKGQHVCARDYNNKHATAKYLSVKYQDKIRGDPQCAAIGFQNDIRRDLMINVSVAKIRRAKRCAKDEMLGTDMEQYHHLWSYAATIRETNPGSTVKIKLDTAEEGSQGTFQRLYYCLYACKQGFLDGCRPIIGLDGCFLKSAFGGQLLSAIGRDGNDNMVPIAVAVVEVERYDSWKWFLELLMADLGLGVENIPWTFISDRQKGLVHAVNELFPNSEHRFCLRHMYQNFKQKFKGKELKDLFWAAASAGNEVDWKLAMNSLEKASKDAAEWLQKVPSVLWSRSHFRQSSKCDILVNNLCESFNNYILEARELPVIGMLEWIRRRLMQRIQVKRTGMQKFQGKICPNIAEKIDRNLKFSRLCIPTWDGKNKYEIDCGPRKSVVVDLKEKTCTCGYFQLTGQICRIPNQNSQNRFAKRRKL